MHPAFSVIVFSTLTGLGYGVWVWASIALATRRHDVHGASMDLMLIAAAVVPVLVGLVSSTFHLGKPLRAWRAFSQWRTSWLSREGVLAVAAFVAWAVVMGMVLVDVGEDGPWFRVALVALALLSLGTVVCTAMIYASLKPIPAWRHRAVVPTYLLLAGLTGGLFAGSAEALLAADVSPRALVLLLLAVAFVVGKRRYWRDIDRGELPATRASALGLPAERVAAVFERPHTEASYLTKEMGFIVARRHSARLRRLALLLAGSVPMLACVLALLWPPAAAPALCVAAFVALLGAFVERWLFFAEAKHLVTLYY